MAISWLNERLLASEKELYSFEPVTPQKAVMEPANLSIKTIFVPNIYCGLAPSEWMTNIEASDPHSLNLCGPYCFMTKKVTELPARYFKPEPVMRAITSHCTQRAGNLINCHPYLYETMLFDLLRFQHEQGNQFR